MVSAPAHPATHQREALVLRFYGGPTEAESAEATGISCGTVKSTASAARKNLSTVLDRGT